MTNKDWKEIRELRKEFIGTSKGIALGNLIAEKQRLDKVRQIVNAPMGGKHERYNKIVEVLKQDN